MPNWLLIEVRAKLVKLSNRTDGDGCDEVMHSHSKLHTKGSTRTEKVR